MTAAAAAALALALTACGDDSGSGSGSTTPEAWAEKVCKSVEGDVAALKQTPDIDQSDPQKAKDGMTAYLGQIATALGRMAGGIRDAGAPPVADGAQAADRVTTALEDAKKTVDEAKANLEQAPVNDAAAFQEAFAKVGEDLGALSGLDDPTKDLESNQQLKEAFDKAPTCKKLDEGSNSTPTS
jgi:hypothetical protein